MKPAPFAYHRAGSVDEAIDLLAELGGEAKLLAGGQSLIPLMNFRLARPRHLIDVWGIPGGDRLEWVDGELVIGPAVTQRRLETAPELGGDLAEVRRMTSSVGHLPVRVRGTVVGSVAHGDPAAEWPLLVTALDATIVARSRRGTRRISGGELYTGFLTTALEPDEMIVEVRLPHPGAMGFAEVARRHGDFALVAVVATLDLAGGQCREARIAAGGVATTPVRLRGAEEALAGRPLTEEAIAEAAAEAGAAVEPVEDIHASAGYRRRLTRVLTERALARAVGVVER